MTNTNEIQIKVSAVTSAENPSDTGILFRLLLPSEEISMVLSIVDALCITDLFQQAIDTLEACNPQVPGSAKEPNKGS